MNVLYCIYFDFHHKAPAMMKHIAVLMGVMEQWA